MMSSESRTKTIIDSMNLRINSTSSSIKQDMRDITSNTTRKLRDEFNTKLEVCESTYAGLANQLVEFINSTNENHVKGRYGVRLQYWRIEYMRMSFGFVIYLMRCVFFVTDWLVLFVDVCNLYDCHLTASLPIHCIPFPVTMISNVSE